MGRAPCCAKVGLRRGPWTTKEDALLTKYIQVHGEGNWRSLPKKAGLLRCGKSCRLRWLNYLRPDIKRGNITPDEDDLITKMHSLLGNRWSLIAGRLPGRTDNEIKNYWNTHLSKKLRIQGTDPNTHKKMPDPNAKEPKKRRIMNSKKKQTKMVNKPKSKAETDEKLKVHNPKPIRISSLSSFSTLSRNSSSSNWSQEGDHDKGLFGTEDHVDVNPWPSFKEEGDNYNNNCHGIEANFLIGEDDRYDHDIVVGGCSELESHPSMSDNNLEKLYEEYLQLLNTEDDQVQLDSVDDLINNNNNDNS